MIKDIIKELSLKYGKDKRVIEQIVSHPLKFASRMIESDDERAMRFNNFATILPHPKFDKQYYAELDVDTILNIARFKDIHKYLRDDKGELELELKQYDTKEKIYMFLLQLLANKEYLRIRNLKKVYMLLDRRKLHAFYKRKRDEKNTKIISENKTAEL